MPIPDRVHSERHRAESFGGVAAQYDRFRPSYPVALVDDLAARAPRDVLDVGCGTGKAGRLFVERGFPVLGVEIDVQMATIARSHGLVVEQAPFETWNAQGRQFDLIICGQAWHWIEPSIGVPKAAALLRPGGTIALFWNTSELDDPVQAALDAAYRRFLPALARKVDVHKGADPPYAGDFDRSGRFEPVVECVYPWAQTYSRDDWLALIQTHSDHVVLPAEQRARLVAAVGEAIDALGGTIVARYRTRAVLARVR